VEEPFVKEWVRQIRPLLPKNARIETDRTPDVIIKVDWKLNDDPSRPHKRSRLLAIIVREEAVLRCTDFRVAGLQIAKIIKNKLTAFDGNHHTPRCGRRPTEKWIISSQDLDPER
jgi:hypothetical protein